MNKQVDKSSSPVTRISLSNASLSSDSIIGYQTRKADATNQESIIHAKHAKSPHKAGKLKASNVNENRHIQVENLILMHATEQRKDTQFHRSKITRDRLATAKEQIRKFIPRNLIKAMDNATTLERSNTCGMDLIKDVLKEQSYLKTLIRSGKSVNSVHRWWDDIKNDIRKRAKEGQELERERGLVRPKKFLSRNCSRDIITPQGLTANNKYHYVISSEQESRYILDAFADREYRALARMFRWLNEFLFIIGKLNTFQLIRKRTIPQHDMLKLRYEAIKFTYDLYSVSATRMVQKDVNLQLQVIQEKIRNMEAQLTNIKTTQASGCKRGAQTSGILSTCNGVANTAFSSAHAVDKTTAITLQDTRTCRQPVPWMQVDEHEHMQHLARQGILPTTNMDTKMGVRKQKRIHEHSKANERQKALIKLSSKDVTRTSLLASINKHLFGTGKRLPPLQAIKERLKDLRNEFYSEAEPNAMHTPGKEKWQERLTSNLREFRKAFPKYDTSGASTALLCINLIAKRNPEAIHKAREKLCLLLLSYEARDMVKISFQLAAMFAYTEIFRGCENVLMNWFDWRKIPIMLVEYKNKKKSQSERQNRPNYVLE